MAIVDEETNEEEKVSRGKRLKEIRKMLRLTRTYLQEKYHLPEVTLKSWENGTTKLTAAGAERCVQMYREEGILVSAEWILKGIGLDPKKATMLSEYFSIPLHQDVTVQDEELLMMKDAQLFKENHKDAVIMIVSNDEMRPFYFPGDYVGGRLRAFDKIESAINKDCIVYLKNGEKFFKRLIRDIHGYYNLTSLNPTETTAEPVLYRVEIERVAPIIWHRRKDI